MHTNENPLVLGVQRNTRSLSDSFFLQNQQQISMPSPFLKDPTPILKPNPKANTKTSLGQIQVAIQTKS